MSISFTLDPRLASDTVLLGCFELCQVRLMRDHRYLWLILVPMREGVTEIFQLSEHDRALLAQESYVVQTKLASAYQPDSLNIASLGNVVTQLHMHHVVRYQDDPAWPGPVWGHSPAQDYNPETLQQTTEKLSILLEL